MSGLTIQGYDSNAKFFKNLNGDEIKFTKFEVKFTRNEEGNLQDKLKITFIDTDKGSEETEQPLEINLQIKLQELPPLLTDETKKDKLKKILDIKDDKILLKKIENIRKQRQALSEQIIVRQQRYNELKKKLEVKKAEAQAKAEAEKAEAEKAEAEKAEAKKAEAAAQAEAEKAAAAATLPSDAFADAAASMEQKLAKSAPAYAARQEAKKNPTEPDARAADGPKEEIGTSMTIQDRLAAFGNKLPLLREQAKRNQPPAATPARKLPAPAGASRASAAAQPPGNQNIQQSSGNLGTFGTSSRFRRGAFGVGGGSKTRKKLKLKLMPAKKIERKYKQSFKNKVKLNHSQVNRSKLLNEVANNKTKKQSRLKLIKKKKNVRKYKQSLKNKK